VKDSSVWMVNEVSMRKLLDGGMGEIRGKSGVRILSASSYAKMADFGKRRAQRTSKRP